MKICSNCNQYGDFGPDPRSIDALQSNCRACRRSYQRWQGLRRFWPGSTAEQAKINFNKLFTEQDGCCAVCNKHQSEMNRAISVDHDHETGQVRGLLCGACNRAIGILKDSADTLDKAATYLRRSKLRLVKNENQ